MVEDGSSADSYAKPHQQYTAQKTDLTLLQEIQEEDMSSHLEHGSFEDSGHNKKFRIPPSKSQQDMLVSQEFKSASTKKSLKESELRYIQRVEKKMKLKEAFSNQLIIQKVVENSQKK